MSTSTSTSHAAPRKSAEEVALGKCKELQHMIEINSVHLENLRTPLARGTHASDLTKQEIRTLEGKLIKHFSHQLAIKSTTAAASLGYPKLSCWLTVVGVQPESKEAIMSRVASLDQLKEKTESELNRLLLSNTTRLNVTQRNEDIRRLSKALQNLRKFTDALIHGHGGTAGKMELHWDSWAHVGGAPVQWPPASDAAAHPSSTSPKKDYSGSKVGRGGGNVSAPLPVSPSYKTPGQVSAHYRSAAQQHQQHHQQSESAASSVSSTSSSTASAPPPSPGLTLSPPAVMPWPERKPTPPTTPPWSAGFFGSVRSSQKFPTTPPPNKKHSTTSAGATPAAVVSAAGKAAVADYPLTKSKSHECELGHRIGGGSVHAQQQPPIVDHNGLVAPARSKPHHPVMQLQHMPDVDEPAPPPSSAPATTSNRRKRLSTEPAVMMDEDFDPGVGGAPSPLASPSPFESAGGDALTQQSSSTLQVPKSPRTPRSMGHTIRHMFKKTFLPTKCDHCSDVMLNGLKCKECKFKCHRECSELVPAACSLPEELSNYYIKQLAKEGSPILTRAQAAAAGHTAGGGSHGRGGGHIPPYQDSSSNTSSCNSSAPASPAVMLTSAHPTPPNSAAAAGGYHHHHQAGVVSSGGGSWGQKKFTFPEPPITLKLQDQPVPPTTATATTPQHQKVQSPNPIIDSVKSYDSDKTLSGTSGSSGSAGTAYRLDSQDSTASVDYDASGTWTAGRQTSVSLREWDIPYEELVIGDRIGSGRFSTVHQGSWHGDVAIKILKMDSNSSTDDDATLEAFRLDVTTFRKIRHENLILFMGACMNPPKLAIVTSLCKGDTLYTHLHLIKTKHTQNKIIMIAQQIAQAMGYLHHRSIVHKDLKTKNIFLENSHAIIADFGLVNVTRRLCGKHNTGLAGGMLAPRDNQEYKSMPKELLCYLAPEIMRSLRVQPPDESDGGLPFTKSSDVFAFGTVWYELLTQEWPWKDKESETIIWLQGKGMMPPMANLQWNKEVKELLMMCWTFKPDYRPDFATVSNLLEAMPRKRGEGLVRSPSHPVQLSRSVESVF